MKVLVACEFSGIVRDAFIRYGHDATSCDIIPSESPGPHIQKDVRTLLLDEYDLMIAHPPCTHLAVSGAKHFYRKQKEQQEALEFVQFLMNAPVHKICIENPISIISTRIRKPDQYINPFEFGHSEFKKTSLWLKNLQPLVPTWVVYPTSPNVSRIHRLTPSDNRSKERSRFYVGIADAMARQWGNNEVPKPRQLVWCIPTEEELQLPSIPRFGGSIYTKQEQLV